MNEHYPFKNYFAMIDFRKIRCFLVIFPLLTTLTFSPLTCGLTLRDADGQSSTITGQKTFSVSNRFKRDVAGNSEGNQVKTVGADLIHNKEAETPLNCSLPSNANNSNCAEKKTSEDNNSNNDAKSIFSQMKENQEMLLRTLYVILGVTGIVVLYFIIRAVRLRRKRTKSRKYGIITQQGDRGGDMEMEPLGDGDDDEEDYTVFEVNGRKK